MLVKTYEDDYRDCQEAFMKLLNENKKLRAEIERKDKVLENVIYTCEQYHGNATGLHMASEFLITNCRQALSEEV